SAVRAQPRTRAPAPVKRGGLTHLLKLVHKIPVYVRLRSDVHSERGKDNNSMSSVYERIGGEAAVDAAVDLFYRKVLADDRISHFFDTVDMDRQRAKQKAFLTMAFGGPHNYSGQDMRAAHAKMNLNEGHFDAVMENLGATLKELGVPDELIGEAAAIALSVKDDVLNR